MLKMKTKKLLVSCLTAVLAISFTTPSMGPALASANQSASSSEAKITTSSNGDILLQSYAKATPTPKVKKKVKATPTPKPSKKKKPTPKPTKKPKATATPKPTATSTPTPAPVVDLDSLKSVYSPYFKIGAATPDIALYKSVTKNLISKHFNSITMENEMKPDSLININKSASDSTKYYTTPAVNLNKLDKYLRYAQDNNLQIRFHTLVWHSQTPKAFFTENYTQSGPLVSREVMLQRMESYIQQIMEYTKQYPGVIYAWDVVNEAIDPGHGAPNGYRKNDSLWYQVVGEDFVEMAFTYARKYSYDDSKLFYNDYGEFEPAKKIHISNMLKKLKEKGLVDGMGMQSHIDMSYPSTNQFESAIRTYNDLGLEVHITELDMHNNKNTPDALQMQADRYRSLFEMFVKLRKEGVNLTSVTFWGIIDSDSWLTGFRKETSYPLLFDASGNPKPCFDSIKGVVTNNN